MTMKSVDKKTEIVKPNKPLRQSIRPKVTKKVKLINLLRKTGGVDITSLSKKLGWQSHSTRAAMTGLRKSGYVIELTKSEDGEPSRYRLSHGPVEQGG